MPQEEDRSGGRNVLPGLALVKAALKPFVSESFA
jgi:hypothetical protein